MTDLLSKHYYHGLMRKYVTAFGDLFSHIQVVRFIEGVEHSRIVVPIAYGPREKWHVRNTQDPDFERLKAIQLPRMSFEITDYTFDATRHQPSMAYMRHLGTGVSPTDVDQMQQLFTPVPYNFTFQLNLITKSADDAAQIVEQILPLFTPDYGFTLNTIPAMNVKTNVSLNIAGVNCTDTWSTEDFNERRIIEWSMTFVMKAWLYGPVRTKPVVKEASINIDSGSTVTTAYDGETIINNQKVVPITTDLVRDNSHDYGFSDIDPT